METCDSRIRDEYSGGRNFSHTLLNSDVDLKVFETEAATHASRGLVREIMLPMQSSGKSSNGEDSETLACLILPMPRFFPIDKVKTSIEADRF